MHFDAAYIGQRVKWNRQTGTVIGKCHAYSLSERTYKERILVKLDQPLRGQNSFGEALLSVATLDPSIVVEEQQETRGPTGNPTRINTRWHDFFATYRR